MSAVTLSARELVLRVAAATEGAQEDKTIGPNRSVFVDRCNAITGARMGSPWCASLVAMVGVTALGKAWPLPKTAGCATLGDFAKRQGILVTEPTPGDVFLLFFPSMNRFAHTGFVTKVLDGKNVETIEGNTNLDGSRDGWGVFRRIRAIGPHDRFIRWEAP